MDSDTFTQSNSVIDKVEHGLRMQTDIDTAYDCWCKIVSLSIRCMINKPLRQFTLILCTLWEREVPNHGGMVTCRIYFKKFSEQKEIG